MGVIARARALSRRAARHTPHRPPERTQHLRDLVLALDGARPATGTMRVEPLRPSRPSSFGPY